MTIDVIDWFWGSAATKACRQDHVTNEGNEWCNDYYYRNRNSLLRTYALPPNGVNVLDGSATIKISSEAFIAKFESGQIYRGQAFHFVTQSNHLTDLTEQFTP